MTDPTMTKTVALLPELVERVARAIDDALPESNNLTLAPSQIRRAAIAAIEATQTDQQLTELDANGEAMICEGCGTTKTIAAILAQHGPKAIACCPERKMVRARHYWETQSPQQLREEVERLREVLDIARHELRRQHDGVDFERTKRCRGLIEQIDDALSSSSLSNG